MPGVKGAVLLMAVSAVTIGGALNGCGGTLNGRGTGGNGGTATTSGTAGEMTPAAGTSGGAGTGGMGGLADDGGFNFGQPACSSEVSSASPCVPNDVQLCYRACGVQLVGAKAYTCTGGLYQQMPGCSYDSSRNYSCYKIPTLANTACPLDVTPQASRACDVPPCMLCNSLQGIDGGHFLDSPGADKIGFCVCQPPDASGIRTWSCATSWPCPLGAGC